MRAHMYNHCLRGDISLSVIRSRSVRNTTTATNLCTTQAERRQNISRIYINQFTTNIIIIIDFFSASRLEYAMRDEQIGTLQLSVNVYFTCSPSIFIEAICKHRARHEPQWDLSTEDVMKNNIKRYVDCFPSFCTNGFYIYSGKSFNETIVGFQSSTLAMEIPNLSFCHLSFLRAKTNKWKEKVR